MESQVTCGGGAERQSSDAALSNAIHDIDNVNERLNALIARIKHSDEKEPNNNPKEVRPFMSLAEIMGGGATLIRDKNNMAHEAINEIEQLLF